MRFVVTAGPTREHLDPVRFLSNPSTGRMGFAVARAARRRGHDVFLVAGPVALKTPPGVKRVDVTSARDMLGAVMAQLASAAADGASAALVMTAAVADWRPAEYAAQKLKKGAMDGTLRLVRNPDILLEVKSAYERGDLAFAQKFVRIGFAAETGAPTQEAARKCRTKGLDMVVGNDVMQPGCGFATATNQATLVRADGAVERLPMMGKLALANRIVRFAEQAANHG